MVKYSGIGFFKSGSSKKGFSRHNFVQELQIMIVKFCCSVHISEYFNKRIPLSLQQQLILWAVVKPEIKLGGRELHCRSG